MGMTLEQVISILGKPREIENFDGQHNFNCKNPNFLQMRVKNNTDIIYLVDRFFNDTSCCDAYKEDKQRLGKNVTLTYTQVPYLLKSLFIPYPMLWVHLDSNYCVQSVYAKQYDFINDICIYSLSWQMDTTSWEYIPGEIDLLINNELFSKYFK
jgi:hypothetical protein